MLIDTTLGSASSAPADAMAWEEAGFDGAFTGEVRSDPFLPLAVAATTTSRIALGTSIAVALSRSPMSLAYTSYDLNGLCRGRFVLGLGSQVRAHITRRFSMPWGRPVPQMREFVLALRSAWRCWCEGEQLGFEGDYYSHSLMPPAFVPEIHPFGPPPVFLAGVGPEMTRVAGEVADGFLCHAFTTEKWLRQVTLPALREGRVISGRSPSSVDSLEGFTIKAAVFLATGGEREMLAAIRAIRSQVAFYGSTPSYRPVLEAHGWGELGAELTALSKAGRWDDMANLIDDDVLHAFAVVGPVEEIPGIVGSRYGDVVDRISFVTPSQPGADLLRAVAAWGV